MSLPTDVESTTLTHRVVLFGLAELSAEGETPAHVPAVLPACNEVIDAIEGDVLGRLTEADGARALKELASTDLVASERDAESPTGKGRPRYRLAVDRESLLEALAEDDRVAPAVDRASG